MSRPTQQDLFEADLSFVQIFKSLIRTGTLATIKPAGLAVLVVLKTNVSYQTGRTSIPIREIASQTGLTRPTVLKAIKLLEENELISVERVGTTRKRNIYKVIERIPFSDAVSEVPAGELAFPVHPRRKREIDNHVASFLTTGEVPHGSPVVINLKIDTLMLHTGTGDNKAFKMGAGDEPIAIDTAKLPPEVQQAFERMVQRASKDPKTTAAKLTESFNASNDITGDDTTGDG